MTTTEGKRANFRQRYEEGDDGLRFQDLTYTGNFVGMDPVTDGILGSFTFDRGDISPARVTVLRVTGSTPRNVRLPIYLEGADVERVIETTPAYSVIEKFGDAAEIARERDPRRT